MDGTLLLTLVLAGLFVLVLWIRNASQYDLGKAREDLKSGAALIDVRTEGEYIGGNVPGAVNIPLIRIVEGVEARFPDKSRTLLCYCASGGRSGLAVGKLKSAGYLNARNLGSLNRARKVLEK